VDYLVTEATDFNTFKQINFPELSSIKMDEFAQLLQFEIK
jgi:hypothetical protein